MIDGCVDRQAKGLATGEAVFGIPRTERGAEAGQDQREKGEWIQGRQGVPGRLGKVGMVRRQHRIHRDPLWGLLGRALAKNGGSVCGLAAICFLVEATPGNG
jgi:hypothetical protein